MSSAFRIAICNLQLGVGTTKGYWQYLTSGWKYLLPHDSEPIRQAASFLQKESIDIAALCEVEGVSWRSKDTDQLKLLAQTAHLPHSHFFPTYTSGSWKRQGNAVGTRFGIHRTVKNHPLPGRGEPRFLSEAKIQLGAQPVRLFITHLSLYQKMREPQIERVDQIINQEKAPTILAGDFNIAQQDELKLLTESQLQLATSAPTFPSWKPNRWLDHLFFSNHFRIKSCYTFDEFYFSDHLPLLAEVELKSAQA